MVKLVLVRHGETNYNVARLVNADPTVDVHLTEKGIEQAKEAGKILSEEKFDAIYVSELRRTSQTAKYINVWKMPLTTDSRLNDVKTGLEGRHEELYDSKRLASGDPINFKYGEGESFREVYSRVKEFLSDIEKLRYEKVLIVTSEIIINCFIIAIDGLGLNKLDQMTVPNGGVVRREN